MTELSCKTSTDFRLAMYRLYRLGYPSDVGIWPLLMRRPVSLDINRLDIKQLPENTKTVSTSVRRRQIENQLNSSGFSMGLSATAPIVR